MSQVQPNMHKSLRPLQMHFQDL